MGGGHPDIFLFSPGKIHLGPGGAGGGGGSDYDLGMSSGSLAMMSVTRSNVLRYVIIKTHAYFSLHDLGVKSGLAWGKSR